MSDFDYSQFEEYVKNFEKATDEFDNFLRKFLLQMAYRVIARVRPRTPVDTGFLRESWFVGDEAKVIKEGNDGKFTSNYSSAFASKASLDSVKVKGNTLEIEIGNIAEYASFIEFGHAYENGKWYQGKFMLTISIDEIQQQIPKRFEQEFKKFLIDRGVG